MICTSRVRRILFVFLIFEMSGCQSFVDVELTNSQVTSSVVFNDDNTAISAITGIYYEMATNMISAGEVNSMNRLSGLSADELIMVSEAIDVIDFQNNQIVPESPNISSLWNSLYKIIYDANAMIEGLNESDKLSFSVKDQLLGEAMFIRAFCHFYLVNFFGDVPIVTSTNYATNASIPRSPSSSVYSQILSDLISARELLSDDYPGLNRIRPNVGAANALLGKVYLYLGDWESAKISSSYVIESDKYEIVEDLSAVFLKESKEAIWQIAPPDVSNVTYEALYFVISDAPRYLVLRDTIVNSFEEGDARLDSWVGTVEYDGKRIYYPHKYKLQSIGLPTAEYSIVLRLSEQYLIRSEARAMLGDIGGSIADLDVVRKRASVGLVVDEDPSIDVESLLKLIQNERKVELFTEWSNRWFDLKRLSLTQEELGQIKDEFVADDELYPIPQVERDRNRNLGDQNPGY